MKNAHKLIANARRQSSGSAHQEALCGAPAFDFRFVDVPLLSTASNSNPRPTSIPSNILEHEIQTLEWRE